MSEKIIQSNMLQMYKDETIRYAMYVNWFRALPDIRDGLKNIHRRIVYMMFLNNYTNHTIKTARVVGDVMGRLHPHGDASIEGTIKTLVNDFEIKYPLLVGQGNFGTKQGDNAAAARYTEIKLSQFSIENIIAELAENPAVCEWVDNFDNTMKEPTYLPNRVPNLLINGAFGIGWGLKCEIPRHNLNEVIDATIALIRNPNADIRLVPEHCQNVEIIGNEWKRIANTGHGYYYARGIVDVVDNTLIIRSLPDLVFLDKVIEKIEELAKDGSIHISDMFDNSSRDSLEYHIVLKKGSDPYYVRDILYKRTELQKRCTVNAEVLYEFKPLRVSYKSYLLNFIELRKTIKFILYTNLYQKAQTKMHEKQRYVEIVTHPKFEEIKKYIASVDVIDELAMVEYLVSKFNMTDLQARFILNVKLKNLSKAYISQYQEEIMHWESECMHYIQRIENEDLIVDEIVSELFDIKKKYGRPRNCPIIDSNDVSNIPKGEFKVIITEDNFIKKLPVNFDHNSSKGRATFIINGQNTETIYIFDELGKVYSLPIHKIPMGDKSSAGQDIRTIIKSLTCGISNVIYAPQLTELANLVNDKYFLTVLTAGGNIKKMDLDDFANVPPSGFRYITLDNNDRVVSAEMVHSKLDVVVYSDNQALRMPISDIPHQKRNTKGMKAMATNEFLDGMSVLHPKADTILVVTEKGNVNKFDISGLQRSSRNKPGSIVISMTRGDRILSILNYLDQDGLFLSVELSGNNLLHLALSDVPKMSSVSPGKKFISKGSENILKTYISKA